MGNGWPTEEIERARAFRRRERRRARNRRAAERRLSGDGGRLRQLRRDFAPLTTRGSRYGH